MITFYCVLCLEREKGMVRAMKKNLIRRTNGNETESNNLGKKKFLIKINKKSIVILFFMIVIALGFVIKNVVMSNGGLKEDQYTVLIKKSNINSIEVKGEVESEDSVDVCSNTNNVGYAVNKINVKIGDKVKAGDILATLDTSQLEKDIEYSQALAETTREDAKAKLETAKNEYENLLNLNNNGQNDEIITAEANLNSSSITLEDAQKNYDNNKLLFQAQAISQNEFNQYEEALKKAQADYDKAKKTLEGIKSKLQADLDNAKNKYKEAQVAINDNTKNIQLEIKQKQLEDCTIKAPCDGTITEKNIEVGGFPSGTLFKIQDLNNIYIKVTVKEVNVPDIKVGQKAEIKTDSLKNEPIEGEVLSIDPIAKSEAADPLSLNDDSIDKEAEYNAKIKINELSDKVNVGMKAKVNIILEEKEAAYIVSSNSIVNNNNSHSIYVVEKQDKQYVIKEIPVSLGTEGDSDIEIVGDGLYNGIIVINDPMKYKVGQVVNIKEIG